MEKFIKMFERDLSIEEKINLVTMPIPTELGTVQMIMKEDKHNFVLAFSEAHQFIMWGHKESWRLRPKHRISLSNKKTKRYDMEYLAKLKTNLLGTQATLYDCIFNKGKTTKKHT